MSAAEFCEAIDGVRSSVLRALRPRQATSRIVKPQKSSVSTRTVSAASALVVRRAAEARQKKENDASENIDRIGDVVRIFLALRDECTSPLALYAADGRLRVFNKAFENVTGWNFAELRAAQEAYAAAHPRATSEELQKVVADRLYPLTGERNRVEKFLKEYLRHDAQRGYSAYFTGLHKSDLGRFLALRTALDAAGRQDLVDRLESRAKLPGAHIVAALPGPVLAALAKAGVLMNARKSGSAATFSYDSERPDETLKTFTIQFTTLPEEGGSFRIGTDMTERVAAAFKNGLSLSDVLPKPVAVAALGADTEDHPVERLSREYHRRLLSVMGDDPDSKAYGQAESLMDDTVFPVARVLDVIARRGPHQFMIFEPAAAGPDGRERRDFPLYVNPAREDCTGIPQAVLQKWVAEGKDVWLLNYQGARLKEVRGRLRSAAASAVDHQFVMNRKFSPKSDGTLGAVDLASLDSDPDQKDGERVLVCSTFPMKRLRFHYNRDETFQRKLELRFIERLFRSDKQGAEPTTPATSSGADDSDKTVTLAVEAPESRVACDDEKTVALEVDVPAVPPSPKPGRPRPRGFDENADTIPGDYGELRP